MSALIVYTVTAPTSELYDIEGTDSIQKRALCPCERTESVHCTWTVHLWVQLQCTLHVSCSFVSELTMYTESAMCTWEWTYIVKYKCNVLHAHSVYKCCVLCTDLTHRGCKVCCWRTCGVYRRCTTIAGSALLCRKLLQSEILALRNTLLAQKVRTWCIAVQKSANCSNFMANQCTTVATYRTSIDSRTHGRWPPYIHSRIRISLINSVSNDLAYENMYNAK